MSKACITKTPERHKSELEQMEKITSYSWIIKYHK